MDEVIRFRITSEDKKRLSEYAELKGFKSLSDWLRHLAEVEVSGKKEKNDSMVIPEKKIEYEADEYSQGEPPALSAVDRVVWAAFRKKMGRPPKSLTELAEYKESSGMGA